MAFLPAIRPPHKRSLPLTLFALRKQMLELCLPFDARFRLCLVEAERGLAGTTLETIQKLRELGFSEDRCHLIWVMGTDSLLDLENWHEPERLLDSIEFAVLPRPGYNLADSKPDFWRRVTVISTPLIELASCHIRQGGQALDDSMPPAVAEFIRKNSLYAQKG